MPLPRDPLFALQDIAESAEAIADYTAGVDEEAFFADPMRRDAVERRFMTIGEALTRLERAAPELAARLPMLRKAVGFRNILAHDDDDIDFEIVQSAALHHLPELRRTVETLLAELDSAQPPPSADREEQ